MTIRNVSLFHLILRSFLSRLWQQLTFTGAFTNSLGSVYMHYKEEKEKIGFSEVSFTEAFMN